MVTRAQYLTGDKEGIEAFIGRFDVSRRTVYFFLDIFFRSLKAPLPSLTRPSGLPV